MRIDSLLKTLCLVKTRSLAQKGCETGSVRIGGAVVKSSRIAVVGDLIEIHRPGHSLVVELLEMPPRQVSKKDAPRFYRVVRETRTG
jgi:ribosomal 50S subunit-recycling heat shock protein